MPRDVASAYKSNRYEILVLAVCFVCDVKFKYQCDAVQFIPEFSNSFCLLVYRLIQGML